MFLLRIAACASVILAACSSTSSAWGQLDQATIDRATLQGTTTMRVMVRQKSTNAQINTSKQKAISPANLISQNLSLNAIADSNLRANTLARKLVNMLSSNRQRPAAASRFDPNLLALSMSKQELMVLLQDSSVEVYEDKLLRPSLSDSVPVVFSNQATAGFNGSGRRVALLDFGVAPNHSFLRGRLRRNASACFSNRGMSSAGQTNPDTASLCPNQAGNSTGGASGDNCPQSVFGCEHGTQMAGIIAGSNGSMNGVATRALIVSIQVGTQINDETVCGDASITPCVGAFSFDIQEALNYVRGIAFSERIAAVNISLSTEAALQGRCDDDPLGPAVNSLFAVGVGVIASSGNSSSQNAMSSPACISRVIAVAATNNNDVALSINNRSSELDFFAPGQSINTSALPSGSFASHEYKTHCAQPALMSHKVCLVAVEFASATRSVCFSLQNHLKNFAFPL